MIPATQPNTNSDRQADPVDDLLDCQAAIRDAGWWHKSGLTEHWPMTTDDAAQMLATAGEFDIDAEGLLDLLERRLLPRPSEGEASELEWSATDVIAAHGLLENRQQWRATPSGHDPQKHPCQLILEHARAAGEVDAITAGEDFTGPRFDVRHLLILLAANDHREGRQKILVLLKALLESEHGVLIV